MPSSPAALPRLAVGDVCLRPIIRRGFLESLGRVTVGRTALRSPATRFLPWFDTLEGDLFRRFRFLGQEQRGDTTVLLTRAVSDPDTLFRERRDCSGDLCFRTESWDAAPRELDLRICLAPAAETVDGRRFTGFRYWFEFAAPGVPLHRLIDRQTWELGGNLDDVTLCLRNWLTPPRVRLARDRAYSTVGLDKWASLLPGNLWGRWTLLPSFDLQYGRDGILLGWFDRVSLIRTVIESAPGEDCLRCLDMHLFAQAEAGATNPKTILWSPDRLDDTDALNLWTRVQDREAERARAQFGIPEEPPPAIVFSENVWRGMRFASTYEKVVDTAAEFGADYVFIDPVWEHQQAFQETLNELVPPERQKGTILEKFSHQNMCVTLDFEVAQVLGGEAGLKALCDRAGARGVKIISWMATHYSPNAAIQSDPALRHGNTGIFAARESGRHPDTGYPASCWTANLNGPVADKIRRQLLGVCQRTGLAGFLWDSYCNLGWWQVDYADGSLRPQFDKMAELYATLTRAGLYLQPEALVTFSTHSCCGLHGGNVYHGDLLGYSYNTGIAMESATFIDGQSANDDLKDYDARLIRGQVPIDTLFRAFAHKRIPNVTYHLVPRAEWHAERVAEIKDLFRLYRENRHLMRRRTVLKDDAGVLWESDGATVGTRLLFSFRDQPPPLPGRWVDALTGQPPAEGRLLRNRAYRGDT